MNASLPVALVCGASGLSGQSAARLLRALGHTVILSDRNADVDLSELKAIGCEDVRPREDVELLEAYSVGLVVTAPGVPLSNPIFQAARERNIPIRGENDFGFEVLRKLLRANGADPLFVGITGTDGKSTTTALLTHLLNTGVSDCRAVACGNYGVPLSRLALDVHNGDTGARVYVVECSSFQLEAVQTFHPHVAILLNVAADHLDRYDSFDDYLATKVRIGANQQSDDLFLIPHSLLARVESVGRELRSQGFAFQGRLRTLQLESLTNADDNPLYLQNQKIAERGDFSRPARHDFMNLMFALSALEHLLQRGKLHWNPGDMRTALTVFKGLPHRMEPAGRDDARNIEFINDSKATTVNAVLAALQSFRGRRIHLLAGGRAKGTAFHDLAGHPDVWLYPFGEAAAEIQSATGTADIYPDLKSAFEAAVKNAENQKERGSSATLILLSPGCASYDAFTSYTQRGDYFKELVSQWIHRSTHG